MYQTKTNIMRHFTTTSGETLGTLFCGDNGRTLMQTHDEETRMWLQDDGELCLEDEMEFGTSENLMDLFLLHSTRCTKEEFLRRGWKEERWEEGLSHRLGLSDDGRTFLMR